MFHDQSPSNRLCLREHCSAARRAADRDRNASPAGVKIPQVLRPRIRPAWKRAQFAPWEEDAEAGPCSSLFDWPVYPRLTALWWCRCLRANARRFRALLGSRATAGLILIEGRTAARRIKLRVIELTTHPTAFIFFIITQISRDSRPVPGMLWRRFTVSLRRWRSAAICCPAPQSRRQGGSHRSGWSERNRKLLALDMLDVRLPHCSLRNWQQGQLNVTPRRGMGDLSLS